MNMSFNTCKLHARFVFLWNVMNYIKKFKAVLATITDTQKLRPQCCYSTNRLIC